MLRNLVLIIGPLMLVNIAAIAQTDIAAPSALANTLQWNASAPNEYIATIAPQDLQTRDTPQTHHLVSHIFNYYGYNLDGSGPGKKQNPLVAMMTVPKADQPIVQKFIAENMAQLQQGKLYIKYDQPTAHFVITANAAGKGMVDKLLQQADTAFQR